MKLREFLIDAFIVILVLATWIAIGMVTGRYEQLNETLLHVIDKQHRMERILIDGGL